MKDLIMQIVKALVDQPDEVQIKEVIGDQAHVLELRVAKEDLAFRVTTTTSASTETAGV